MEAAQPPADVIRSATVGVCPAYSSQRLLAWLLDSLIVFLPLNPDLYLNTPSWTLSLALWVPIAFGYFIAFDGGPRGATLGKRLVGIRVIDAGSGTPIGYRRAAIRRVAYVLGGMALYVGWLWLFFNRAAKPGTTGS